MNSITLTPTEGGHVCNATKEKNTVVFTCPHCDYKRTLNTDTGEIKTNAKPHHAPHYGFYLAPGVDCFDSSNN